MTARLEPATIDGLVYASSMVVLYAARHRLTVPALARWLLALGQAGGPSAQAPSGLWLVPIEPGDAGEDSIEAAAVAAYQASLDIGRPLSERKLAEKFGKTSRRWARNRMAEARHRVSLSEQAGC